MANHYLLKQVEVSTPLITDDNVVLLRLGELCNYKCPMCPISGDAERLKSSISDLSTKIESLAAKGFRRIAITGGEPTLHPDFANVVKKMSEHLIKWKINTNASKFTLKLARYCFDNGLYEAIVSLHSHDPSASGQIFGGTNELHEKTINGINSLLSVGVTVMINCVINKLNAAHLVDFVDYIYSLYGNRVSVKFAFPNGQGVGKDWAGVDIKYSEIKDSLSKAFQHAVDYGINVELEGIPNCILDFSHYKNYSRFSWGETHYQDELDVDKIWLIKERESLSSYYAVKCSKCKRIDDCSGITYQYFSRYGFKELTPIQ